MSPGEVAALATSLSGRSPGLTPLPSSLCPAVCPAAAPTRCPCLSPPQNQAEAHYKGHKHARRLKAIEAMKNKQKAAGAAAVATGRDGTADFAPSPEGSGEPGSTGRGAGGCGRVLRRQPGMPLRASWPVPGSAAAFLFSALPWLQRPEEPD